MTRLVQQGPDLVQSPREPARPFVESRPRSPRHGSERGESVVQRGVGESRCVPFALETGEVGEEDGDPGRPVREPTPEGFDTSVRRWPSCPAVLHADSAGKPRGTSIDDEGLIDQHPADADGFIDGPPQEGSS